MHFFYMAEYVDFILKIIENSEAVLHLSTKQFAGTPLWYSTTGGGSGSL